MKTVRGSVSFKVGSRPAGWFALGEEYLIAAKALSAYQLPATPHRVLGMVHMGLPASEPPGWLAVQIPLFYCIAHSAELFVKSYLTTRKKAPPKMRVKNHPDQFLFDAWRKHDLATLLATAELIDLQLEKNTKNAILDVAKANTEYELRFQETGAPVNLPLLAKSISAIEELRQTVLRAIAPFSLK